MENLLTHKMSKKQIVIYSLLLAAFFTLMFLLLTSCPVLADVGDSIKNGITGITTTIKKIVNPIAIVAVIVCAIYMIVGSDPASLRKVKAWMLSIIIGLVIVNLAEPIVNWASALAS